MRLVVLVALCACNGILGLGDVRDRAPPIDAPFACPPIGTTPIFSDVIHQSVRENCQEYARYSTGYATGLCESDPDYHVYTTSEGTGEGQLAAIPALEAPVGDVLTAPRATGDGTLMVVVRLGMTRHVQQYVHTSATWTYDRDLPIADGLGLNIGHLARDATGLRMLVSFGTRLEEWGTASGDWSLLATHSLTALGLTHIGYASLTEDGLRMILIASADNIADAVYFSDRPDYETEFRPADRLGTVPVAHAPFLDHTCARIYIADLESVFFAQQQ